MRLPCSRSMATKGAMTARALRVADVASEDSAEEWGGDGFEDLVAEVAADEGGYAFICNWGGCF